MSAGDQRPFVAAEIRLALTGLLKLPDEDGKIAETMETALGLLNLPRLEARLRAAATRPPRDPLPPPRDPQAEVARLAGEGRRGEAEALLIDLYGEVPRSWAGVLNGSQNWRARPYAELDATADKPLMTFDGEPRRAAGREPKPKEPVDRALAKF